MGGGGGWASNQARRRPSLLLREEKQDSPRLLLWPAGTGTLPGESGLDVPTACGRQQYRRHPPASPVVPSFFWALVFPVAISTPALPCCLGKQSPYSCPAPRSPLVAKPYW